MGSLFFVAYLKGYGKESGWYGVYKMIFFLIYTTGTGMAAFFLRRTINIQRENAEKEKLQKDTDKQQIIVDYVCGMTDQYAINFYKKYVT